MNKAVLGQMSPNLHAMPPLSRLEQSMSFTCAAANSSNPPSIQAAAAASNTRGVRAVPDSSEPTRVRKLSASQKDVLTVSAARLAESAVSAAAYALTAPRYRALCGTALCYVMNPLTGAMVQIRALLDSGADITMLNRQTAQQIGLTGKKINICIAVAGGGTIARCEKEVAFQLVSRDKSFVSTPMVALATEVCWKSVQSS